MSSTSPREVLTVKIDPEGVVRTAAVADDDQPRLSDPRFRAFAERARRAVLDFFNAGSDYTAIFTANATGALKHVGESYPFGPGGRLLLTGDNHNSVNGLREFAGAKDGGTVTDQPFLHIAVGADRKSVVLTPDPAAEP
mgnify:CR=1 FL=1